ncbi:MAG: RNA polymerase sigma factor [Firmicutes bacterium]|nr:RNA polymerase sigma factor [Bacillota bacterium]
MEEHRIPDDSGIVELFLERNEQALVFAARKYGASLRKIALAVLGDESDAQECENDAYLKAWNSIPPNEPRTWLLPYLSKLVRETAIDRLRKEQAKKRAAQFTELTQEIESSLPSLNDVETEVDGALLSAAISAFLRQQPLQKRNIFLRRYWFMDSVAEIAKRYSVSEGKVKTVLFRLRGDLKDHLKREGYLL